MTTQPDQRKLRIAIVGGGIGGLTCAVALKKCQNIELNLYEAAAQIAEIGAGITVWPRTWKILKAMGMEESLVKGLKEKPNDEPKIAFTFRKSDQRDGYTFHQIRINGKESDLTTYGTCFSSFHTAGGNYNFHRKDIQQALLEQVPPFCDVHLQHRVVECEELPDGVKIRFANGKSAMCDMVIGADGIKSVVRRHVRHVSSSDNGVVYTGTVAFRGLVPREKLAELHPGHRTLEEPVNYCGKDRHIVVYPISQGRIVNVVAFYSRPWDEGKPLPGPEVRNATLEEVLEVYAGWEQEVQDLLNCIENPTCWAIQELRPLDSYISGRALLLGDAAHAMTPHLGAGAGQAMEDAYILGEIMARSPCTISDIPRILKIYDSIRQPFANYILTTARTQGLYYEFNAPGFHDVKKQGHSLTEEQKLTLKEKYTEHWSWVSTSVDEDHRRAVAML
ncbi:salicylate hydroxylase [Moniliophthora roreri]|nr:salicylate hydroxylase [Moniliophthora roreri]